MNIFVLFNISMRDKQWQANWVWCVNMNKNKAHTKKNALQTRLSHLFAQYQFPCSLNCYDFWWNTHMWSGCWVVLTLLSLQYTRDVWRFTGWYHILLCVTMCVRDYQWKKRRPKKRNLKARLFVLFYIYLIEVQLCLCENIRNAGYYYVVRTNLLSMCYFHFEFLSFSVWCIAFELWCIYFFFFSSLLATIKEEKKNGEASNLRFIIKSNALVTSLLLSNQS